MSKIAFRVIYLLAALSVVALWLTTYGAISDPASRTTVGWIANTYLAPLKGSILLPVLAISIMMMIFSTPKRPGR